MNDPRDDDDDDDDGVISISSDSDHGEVAPVAGPSNVLNRRAPLAAQGSAELDIPHELDGASRAQLHVAIATAPEERVREAFAALIDSVPAVTERVFSMLVAVPPPAYPPPQQAGEMVPPAAPPWNVYPPPVQAPPVARAALLVPRWQICANCEEEYDAGAVRQAGECNYHTGRLEMNYDAWPDWDEDVHGEMDTTENRRLYPENFTWSCCGCDGTEVGCVEDEHEPREVQRGQKRPRRH
ncbi:uncharacterized protein TRAVEDRAFT_65224 [Trametes versicolor FP-101664 SS1]|uniref:uncharacterized protein n=1 Tax=Trametes versicolor (strain FP-101664) TaxID=717944 RepID=UPI0004623CC1|nr:uncharacterized protein TRAVEDRAFT_65224 [Trametes versicolor FP-101664 SS1]EIW57355.1 hypothetical protein TRAVEDRAFT_65224 [Trametes versicolor FP-101664 SS1]